MREQVIHVALGNLYADPDNVNTHDDTNLSQIEASIQRFGFLDPIGVVENPNRADGGYMVVEGHGRLMVATRLRLAEVPCILLSLEEAERRGYAIAHNQIQKINSLDLGIIGEEFSRLGVAAEDYPSLGFSEEDALFFSLSNGPAAGGSASTPEGTSRTETGSNVPVPEEGKGAWAAFVPAVHRTEMRFASDVGLNRFVALLNLLRGHYPLAETHAERIMLFLRDRGLVEGSADVAA